jgi:hypothetical protein
VKGGSVGLACPSCSPEGGLGCAHKWICDLCAFFSSSKRPLVWECRGCQNPFCDQCPEVHADDEEDEDKCIDCGKGDFFCQDCSQNILNNSPRSIEFEHDQGQSTFSWRCRLCTSPVCSSCLPHSNSTTDCPNCQSSLCGSCRSVLGCRKCGGEMCQLCPAMVCVGCEADMDADSDGGLSV